MGPGEHRHPCLLMVLLSTGQAAPVGLVGQPGLRSDWTSLFCWDERERVRGRSQGGYQGEAQEEKFREGDKMGRSWVERDWDRQRKEALG